MVEGGASGDMALQGTRKEGRQGAPKEHSGGAKTALKAAPKGRLKGRQNGAQGRQKGVQCGAKRTFKDTK